MPETVNARLAQPLDDTCVRCEQPFRIGDTDRCPRDPSGGGHEALPHEFVSGRRDGRCARPNPYIAGASCGFRRDDDERHLFHA